MRILFVCSSSYIYGAEIITLALLEGLQERHHNVKAAVSLRAWGDGEFQQRLSEVQIPYEELPVGFFSKQLHWQSLHWTMKCLVRLPLLWWKYSKLIRNFRPEVVVLTSFRHAVLLWPCLDAARTVLYIHNGGTATERVKRMWRFLDKRLRAYIAVSEFIGRNLQSLGVSREKIIVIKNGVLGKSAHPIPSNSEKTDLVKIGIVGQVGDWKGHQDLIEAAAFLHREGVNFQVYIYGKGEESYVTQLKQLIFENQLTERVKWMGYQNDQRAIYANLDICVVPSRYDDPYPTTALEAAAFGLPVIATQRGGLPEIIRDGQTGFLVPDRNPIQLTEKLRLLLIDKSLRQQMGTAAGQHAWLSFTKERMVTEFETFCSELAQEKK